VAEGVDIVGGGEVQLAGDVEVFVSKRRLVLKSPDVDVDVDVWRILEILLLSHFQGIGM
jgi:hypothetical protein